ncbi:hypothetical protein [Nostoc sp.]|uniref:hypothetical protein n=1 Tax=Nostoc sp. TaxID=1180 RepID=UPI002FF2709A
MIPTVGCAYAIRQQSHRIRYYTNEREQRLAEKSTFLHKTGADEDAIITPTIMGIII